MVEADAEPGSGNPEQGSTVMTTSTIAKTKEEWEDHGLD